MNNILEMDRLRDEVVQAAKKWKSESHRGPNFEERISTRLCKLALALEELEFFETKKGKKL